MSIYEASGKQTCEKFTAFSQYHSAGRRPGAEFAFGTVAGAGRCSSALNFGLGIATLGVEAGWSLTRQRWVPRCAAASLLDGDCPLSSLLEMRHICSRCQRLMQIVHHRNPYSALLGRGPASYRG